MTLLLSPLAQSSLGEKCALYLDHATESIPVFLHSLRPRLDPVLTYSATSFDSVARALPFDTDKQTTAVCAALLVCLLTIATMSWANPLSNLWRRSPSRTSAPQVRDEDFSYITPNDIVDPPSHAPHHGGQYAASHQENEPDIICLRHRGTIYPLHFRAYAIDDGLLTVGALRYEAAAKLGVQNPNQIRLLYKGALLKDDTRLCKAEGLKQHSEVLCVVSEVAATTSGTVPEQDNGTPRPGSSSSRVDGEEAPAPSGKTKKSNNKKKKNKGKKGKEEKPPPRDETPQSVCTPPPQPASGQSSLPPPAPNLKLLKTALDQVTALTGYFQQVLVPLCEEYVANPPTEEKKRKLEYKKLSETIMTQVLLKADGIEPDGNETVRNARKALVKEVHANFNKLDQIGKQ